MHCLASFDLSKIMPDFSIPGGASKVKVLQECSGLRTSVFPRTQFNVCVSGDDDETISRPAKRQITILDLLTHTSGLIYEFTGTTRFIVTIGVTV
jgi:hypothetical protein